MATIKQQGKGYKITVSRGYDINGKQLREHMTWVPSPGMTKRQIKKELNRQTVMFEEQIKASGRKDGNIKFIDFIDIFFNQKKLCRIRRGISHKSSAIKSMAELSY